MNYSLFKKYIDDLKDSNKILNFNGNTLVILDKSYEHDKLTLLENIFKAINISLEKDCVVIHLTKNTKFRLQKALGLKNLKDIFLFGTSPSAIGIHLDLNYYKEVTHLEKTFLNCHSLERISADKKLKMSLWNALKSRKPE